MLERDGGVSNAEHAARIGLSPLVCPGGVQELERSGAITGYRAVLDRARAGRGFLAFLTVNLSDHSNASPAAFERGAGVEVWECHFLTGGVARIAGVEVADLAAYKCLHTNVPGALKGVCEITSSLVMDSPKNGRG